MKINTILIIIASLVLIFGLLFVVYKFTNTTSDYKDITIIQPGDHVKWSPDKKHVLVEFSDLQCPACKAFHDIMTSFESSGSANASIPKKVTLVFRHFPLYQVHENAFEMAYAVEAASRQNKFFELTSAIFADQATLEVTKDAKAFVLDKAKSVGLNTEQLTKDIDSKEVKDKVNADLAQGERAGINGTPTFFLDGAKLDFQTPVEFVEILKKL